jgi:hypothetical protein
LDKEDTYNITEPGCYINRKISEEVKKKMKEICELKKGYKWTEEQKERHKKLMTEIKNRKGTKMSNETKEKLSKARKGIKLSISKEVQIRLRKFRSERERKPIERIKWKLTNYFSERRLNLGSKSTLNFSIITKELLKNLDEKKLCIIQYYTDYKKRLQKQEFIQEIDNKLIELKQSHSCILCNS